MFTKIRTRLGNSLLAFGLIVSFAAVVPAADSSSGLVSSKQVRRELVTLPFYGVFDNLAYKIEGTTVILSGQVVRPTTKSDAGRRVAKLAGVERVVNNIEVLPLSRFDDQIRLATFRRVFSQGSLYRYAQGANPSVHIIVKNGHVTLEGVVANQSDKDLANIAANTVSNVFSVTNNLQVERKRS
jgi:hyperosmotically inducible protein